MSAEGFIVLNRRVMESWLWTLPTGQRCVALTLLFLANWKQGKGWYGGSLVTVKRGQMVTSIDKIAAASGVSSKVVRSAIRVLVECDFIIDEPNNSYRVITICNYSRYQDRGLPRVSAEGSADATSEGTSEGSAKGKARVPNRTREQRNKGTREIVHPEAEREPVRSRSEITEGELESVYQQYPRKQGKAKGIAKAKKLIRTRDEFETFQSCVVWMSEQWLGEDTSFCPLFSTFVNARRWEDEDWPAPSRQAGTQTGGNVRKLNLVEL